MTPSPRRAVPLVAGVLLLTACGSAGPAASRDRVGATSHAAHAAPAPAALGVRPAQAVEQDPVLALRSELERLLGAHVLVAGQLVRATVLQQEGQREAAEQAVARNQSDLVAAVTAQSDETTGAAFDTAWGRHVDLLEAYAEALQTGDTAGQADVREQYAAAEAELAGAFSAVVGGTVPRDALVASATAHGEHLLDHAAAFAALDFTQAATVQREAFAAMITVADVLARGVASAKGLPATELDTPRRDLQSALSRLLAEHMGLMVSVMRAAHDRSPDFAATGDALNANTTEVAGALRVLYGDAASAQFLDIWAGHVEALVEYAGTQDDADRARLRAQGADYAPQLARLLAAATEQRLSAIELAAGLTEHDTHLRDALDAYAAGDLEESDAQADRGYTHMFELAQALATAVGDAVAARLPQGGAATGGGALAAGR